jgi:hypothetical protein
MAGLTCLALCLVSLPGAAEQSPARWLPLREHASALFRDGEARARLLDGLLGGVGHERTQRLPNGTLKITQTRRYDRALSPGTSSSGALPEPWTIDTTLELSSSLRLLRAETRLRVHRSGLRAFDRDARDKLEAFFAWDRLLIVASRDGARLTRSTFRAGKLIAERRYAYPASSIPIEIVGPVLSYAVARAFTSFEYDVLLPDGAVHGVRARVHRTRDASRFARRYTIDTRPLRASGELAVVDMALASPWKRLFFPHHFYFVYASAEPTQLLAFWGGAPDDHLQALREP